MSVQVKTFRTVSAVKGVHKLTNTITMKRFLLTTNRNTLTPNLMLGTKLVK